MYIHMYTSIAITNLSIANYLAFMIFLICSINQYEIIDISSNRENNLDINECTLNHAIV